MGDLETFLLNCNDDIHFCDSSCDKKQSEINAEDCRKCFLKHMTASENKEEAKAANWKDAVMGHFVRVE